MELKNLLETDNGKVPDFRNHICVFRSLTILKVGGNSKIANRNFVQFGEIRSGPDVRPPKMNNEAVKRKRKKCCRAYTNIDSGSSILNV